MLHHTMDRKIRSRTAGDAEYDSETPMWEGQTCSSKKKELIRKDTDVGETQVLFNT